MKTIIVNRDNDRDIRFIGEQIAQASSSHETVQSNFSGSNGRWTELALYRTQAGKLICEQIGRTIWDGERDRHSGAICESNSEVIEFFGNGWLAKQLYADAGIDASIVID